MSVVTFTFIRHGESWVNKLKEDKIAGRCMLTPLTEDGQKQARALGQYFRREAKTFNAAYSSTAVRTQETAKYCFEEMACQLPVEISAELLEQDAGAWEGKSREIYKRSDVALAFSADNWTYVVGDGSGESQLMVAERMKLWVETKLAQHTMPDETINIIVFTHALAIKYLFAEVLGCDRSTAYCEKINPCLNTSLNVLIYKDGHLVSTKEDCVRNGTPHLM
jgi:broad specificity phosphatase PhoE